MTIPDSLILGLEPLIQGYYLCSVATSGSYAYPVYCGVGLEVINVSNPTNCVRVGGYTIPGAVDVAVSGKYAYVADYANGLEVIDVSNPASCVRVGSSDAARGACAVAVSGHYAFVAGAGLQVIDVSDPANGALVAGYSTPGDTGQAVAVSGGYVYYLSDWGLTVLQVNEGPVVLPNSVVHLTDGTFQFRVSSALNQVLEIQVSTNLVNWDSVCLLTNVSGDGLVTDRRTNSSNGFYRARVQ